VVTGALEHAAATRRGRGTRFSVEFLNWAANKVGVNAADGGFFSDLWNGYATHGICPEEDMPYRPQFDRRLQPDETALAHAKEALSLDLELHWIKEWDPGKGLTQAQLVEVKRALSRGWPVCGGFLWPKREEWKDGVLQICPREAVRDGHSVLLVGYREEAGAPGGGLFLIRNSSGPSRDGYLTFEYILTYMNDALWIGCEPGRPAHPVASAFADPLGALASMPGGRNRRISSNEQPAWNDGNSDMTPLVPGQVLELPVLEGPGATREGSTS
jgi:hypothetical protein